MWHTKGEVESYRTCVPSKKQHQLVHNMCHKVHDIGLKNPRYCFQLYQYYASALKYGNHLYKNKPHAYKNNSRLDFAQALLRSPLQEFVRWVGCKEWHKINKFGCWGLVFATLSHWVCPRSLFEWLCRVCPFQRYHLQQPCRKVHLSGVKSSFYFGFQEDLFLSLTTNLAEFHLLYAAEC